jgi:enoyl-CoA hydratase/carnithine racemase
VRVEDFTSLTYVVEDGVARITLDRPEHRNAFTSRLYEELKWAIRRADADPDVDVIVLAGNGTSFAAGGDLHEVSRRLTDDDPLSMYAFFDALPYDALRLCGTTTIAVINGSCYGGGVLAAAWCDISLAADDATFALSEATVGLADALAPSALFGRIPTPKLKLMLFTGMSISAPQAESWGLITESVPAADLESRVTEMVTLLRRTSAPARRTFKRHLAALQPRPYDHGGAEAFSDPDVTSRVRAFIQRASR